MNYMLEGRAGDTMRLIIVSCGRERSKGVVGMWKGMGTWVGIWGRAGWGDGGGERVGRRGGGGRGGRDKNGDEIDKKMMNKSIYIH